MEAKGSKKINLLYPLTLHILPTVGDEVPDGPKEEPCDSVGHDKDKERAAPVEVHQCGEDVGQVAISLLHVAVLHVTAAVLLHVALSFASNAGWWRDGVTGHRVKQGREKEKGTVRLPQFVIEKVAELWRFSLL